jgi:hypothetical protein
MFLIFDSAVILDVMNVYVIGSVRHAKPEEGDKIAVHVAGLKREGHSSYNIVFSELAALKKTEKVDVIWNPESEGSHVDLGRAWSLMALASINLVDDPTNSYLLKDHLSPVNGLKIHC